GTAGELRVPAKFMQEIAVSLPPIPEQQKIVEEIESRLSVAEEIKATIDINLKRSERLRQAILKQAFSGRLV
ncbi:MAG: type I site-specific deoxyribonuclease, partial [Nitrospirota bacterium]